MMKRMRAISIRNRTILIIVVAMLLLAGLIIGSLFIGPEQLKINLETERNEPSLQHPFGTDWLGRDMFARTLKGLTLSLSVGLLAASISTLIALSLSLLASVNKMFDAMITWFIDLFLSVPHLVLLILISFAAGGGFKGVVVGLALTHWPSLTRLLRAEMLQVMSANYVSVSRQLGKRKSWIAIHHVLPHLIPQLVIGFILLFPHAILHEAAITFLGFGLSSEKPAIGVILSESMNYLSTGMWWLAFFPGLSLLMMVGLFEILGRNIRRLFDPYYIEK